MLGRAVGAVDLAISFEGLRLVLPTGNPTFDELFRKYGQYVAYRDSGTPEGDWVAPFLERELLHGLKMIILDPMTTDRVRSYARVMRGRVTGTD
jgi:hypothetical protein